MSSILGKEEESKNTLFIKSSTNHIIYKNKTARAKEKKLNHQIVFDKYIQLLEENKLSSELLYYNIDAANHYFKILDESNKYARVVQNGYTNEEFPIMAEFFPNIKDSIPTIISSGGIGLPKKNMTTEEVYEFIKRREIFGKIDEVKDV